MSVRNIDINSYIYFHRHIAYLFLLKKKHWLRKFENRVLMAVFGSKAEEVKGLRNIQSEVPHNLYFDKILLE